MKLGGVGGANTRSGLLYEGKTDLSTFLSSQTGYSVENGKVFFKGELVARVFKKHDLYKLLTEHGVKWEEIISKRLLPDHGILVFGNNTFFVIEVKYQQGHGSVDEKLQTCDFKKKQYEKLFAGTGITVEYIYLLNDWFKNPGYQDVLDYIGSVGCHFFFEAIPLSTFGLPSPTSSSNL